MNFFAIVCDKLIREVKFSVREVNFTHSYSLTTLDVLFSLAHCKHYIYQTHLNYPRVKTTLSNLRSAHAIIEQDLGLYFARLVMNKCVRTDQLIVYVTL